MKDFPFDPNVLYFVPFSGAGHFGANLNAYIFKEQILLVDLGIGFPNQLKHPNIDSYLPDIAFLKTHKDKIKGLIITHAHEDHVGAIPYLWPQLECSIYATPFSAEFIRRKIRDKPWRKKCPIHEVELSSHLDLGDFSCDFININHSILEPNALSLSVEGYDPIFHTGDWKYDPEPLLGQKTDISFQEALAKKNILAAIGDSTNALVKGHSLSEEHVLNYLKTLFKSKKQRIVVTCFSSNVARWYSISKAAQAVNREVVLVGCSLWNMYECALYAGYLHDMPRFINADAASMLPPDKVVYICTGTQGEKNSGMYRLAYQNHPSISLEKGDCVIFSSFNIPGNESDIIAMKEQFLRREIDVVDNLDDRQVHASGHPNQDELKDLYTRLKPSIVIPVHGETPMLYAHSKIAKSVGVPQTYVPRNGDIIAFEKKIGDVKCVGRIPVSLKIVDQGMIVENDAIYLENRRKLSVAGSCFISVVIDSNYKLVGRPQLQTIGVLEGEDNEEELFNSLVKKLEQNFPIVKKEAIIKEELRRCARRFFSKVLNRKKPMTEVLVHKIKGKGEQ